MAVSIDLLAFTVIMIEIGLIFMAWAIGFFMGRREKLMGVMTDGDTITKLEGSQGLPKRHD